MDIVFMGTPSFAVPALEALVDDGHTVRAVYTRPDAVSGRGKTLRASEVKAAAERLGIPVHTPKDLRDSTIVDEIAAYRPDVIIVAAYGVILPSNVLEIAHYGCLNIHASLLPRWRGAAPIQRAILSGDARTGVSIMQMEAGLDTGAYHHVGSIEVGTHTAVQLTSALAQMGARGIVDALDCIEAADYGWSVQDEQAVTYADKITKAEILPHPGLTTEGFLRRVQASSRQAPARCVICGRTVTILAAHAAPDRDLDQGRVILEHGRVFLGLRQGSVELDTVKPDGKREMEACAWAAGLHADVFEWASVCDDDGKALL